MGLCRWSLDVTGCGNVVLNHRKHFIKSHVLYKYNILLRNSTRYGHVIMLKQFVCAFLFFIFQSSLIAKWKAGLLELRLCDEYQAHNLHRDKIDSRTAYDMWSINIQFVNTWPRQQTLLGYFIAGNNTTDLRHAVKMYFDAIHLPVLFQYVSLSEKIVISNST